MENMRRDGWNVEVRNSCSSMKFIDFDDVYNSITGMYAHKTVAFIQTFELCLACRIPIFPDLRSCLNKKTTLINNNLSNKQKRLMHHLQPARETLSEITL